MWQRMRLKSWLSSLTRSKTNSPNAFQLIVTRRLYRLGHSKHQYPGMVLSNEAEINLEVTKQECGLQTHFQFPILQFKIDKNFFSAQVGFEKQEEEYEI